MNGHGQQTGQNHGHFIDKIGVIDDSDGGVRLSICSDSSGDFFLGLRIVIIKDTDRSGFAVFVENDISVLNDMALPENTGNNFYWIKLKKSEDAHENNNDRHVTDENPYAE